MPWQASSQEILDLLDNFPVSRDGAEGLAPCGDDLKLSRVGVDVMRVYQYLRPASEKLPGVWVGLLKACGRGVVGMWWMWWQVLPVCGVLGEAQVWTTLVHQLLMPHLVLLLLLLVGPPPLPHPLPQHAPVPGIRNAATGLHTDMGLVTVAPCSTLPGLTLLHPSGSHWVQVEEPLGCAPTLPGTPSPACALAAAASAASAPAPCLPCAPTAVTDPAACSPAGTTDSAQHPAPPLDGPLSVEDVGVEAGPGPASPLLASHCSLPAPSDPSPASAPVGVPAPHSVPSADDQPGAPSGGTTALPPSGPPRRYAVVFAGETLAACTGGAVSATLHYVHETLLGVPRISMPFFLRGRPEGLLPPSSSRAGDGAGSGTSAPATPCSVADLLEEDVHVFNHWLRSRHAIANTEPRAWPKLLPGTDY